MTKLSEIGEVAFLAALERRGLIVGTEHDAAVVGDRVVTQDALVEGIHFRLDWLDWRELGFRAGAVNISDLAASGADPDALLVSLAVPATTTLEQALELYEGLAETGVPVVGGDTTASPTVMVAVTALGRSARVPGRAGARPGDVLVVTGPLGAAGAAFRAGRYVRPPLRVAEGKVLARDAHALMDISDGIALDAGRIAYRSGVRCVLELERIPLAEGARLDDLGFGEDFELLAAVEEPGEFAVVGRVEEGEGVDVRLDGALYPLRGYDHFTLEVRGERLREMLFRARAVHGFARLAVREQDDRR